MDTTFFLDELTLHLATLPLVSSHPVTLDVRCVYTPASPPRVDEPGAPDTVEILRLRTQHKVTLLDRDGGAIAALKAGFDLTDMLDDAVVDRIADELRHAFRDELAPA